MSFVSRLKEHPRGFWFVFWGELAERSSYYGMRTLLALYLVDVIGFQEHKGAMTMAFFQATCYLLPVAGGFIADYWLGRYRTILYFFVPYIFGQLLLGNTENPWIVYFALFLLALGSGTIKPSTSPLMGMIYEKNGKQNLLPEAFSWFYLAINLGSFFSTWALPRVRESFKPANGVWTHAARVEGYRVALAVPAVLMIVAAIIFGIGKRYYPKEDVKARPPKTEEQRLAERATLLRIGGIFLIIIFWWLVYDRQADIWIYFARKYMDMRLWPLDITLTPDQVQVVNPLFILLFTPFFNWQWNWISKRRGVQVPPTQKMLLGFVLTLITTVILTGTAVAASAGATVSVWWQILAFAVITYAELCVSMIGLQFAYDQALPGTKSTVTAFFFLTIFVGDMLGGIFSSFYGNPLSPTSYFGVQIVLMAVCTVLFWIVARKFERGSPPHEVAAPAETTA